MSPWLGKVSKHRRIYYGDSRSHNNAFFTFFRHAVHWVGGSYRDRGTQLGMGLEIVPAARPALGADRQTDTHGKSTKNEEAPLMQALLGWSAHSNPQLLCHTQPHHLPSCLGGAPHVCCGGPASPGDWLPAPAAAQQPLQREQQHSHHIKLSQRSWLS